MVKSNPTKVVLADDHVIVRQGLRKLLEESDIQVIGEASDGLEAVKLVETLAARFFNLRYQYGRDEWP